MPDISLNKISRYLIYFFSAFLLAFLSSDHFFFWDSVSQVSVPANFYFNNNFTKLLLPDDIATGHPTFVGMYIALAWIVFGKTLMVSHLAMLPFIFGIFYQIDRIVFKTGLKSSDNYLILFLTFCDATLLSQISMITFDLLHLFFFLWCINSIVDDKLKPLAIAFSLLMLVSLRGALSGAGVILFQIVRVYRNFGHLKIRYFTPFLPGISLFGVFLTWFFIEKGWIIFNPDSPDFKIFGAMAPISGILRNIAVVGWRLIDFGRVGIWLVFLFIILVSIKKRTLFDKFYSDLFTAALCQFSVFFLVVIFIKNPFGHRYFLPVIILVSVAVSYWILRYSGYRYIIYTSLLLILISGYFWVYPAKTSNGWDATPAHWSYFKALKQMNSKIDSIGIAFSEIGAFFPISGDMETKDLKASGIVFPEADLDSDNYILYSNICNVDDRYVDELFDKTKWENISEVKRRNVLMILLKRKFVPD